MMGQRQALDRVRDYVQVGFYIGLVLSLYALVLLLVRGYAPYAALGMSPVAVIGAYLFGGVTVGGIVGLLAPMTSTLIGKIAVGIISALPFSVLLMLTFLSPARIPTALIPLSLILAGFWGLVGGIVAWWISDS